MKVLKNSNSDFHFLLLANQYERLSLPVKVVEKKLQVQAFLISCNLSLRIIYECCFVDHNK